MRDHIFLKVKEIFLTRNLPGGQKGSDVNLPIGFFTGIHLGCEMGVHTWEDPEINRDSCVLCHFSHV